jgi:hypothetical protein
MQNDWKILNREKNICPCIQIFNNISGSKVHIKDEHIWGNIIVVILEIIKDKDTLEIEIDFKNM